MDPQIETAYELEEQGINSEQIVFIFCRADGSASEEAAARRYIKKARVNVLDPVFPERPSIRQAHNTGRAASEVSYPSIRSKVLPLAQAIVDQLNQNHKKPWPIKV